MSKRDIIVFMQMLAVLVGVAGILYFTLCYNDYEQTGDTRILESKHRAGYSTYKPEYALENFLGVKRYKEITFNFRTEPCRLAFEFPYSGSKPKSDSLECAKRRIDTYLADINKEKGSEVVGIEYIKYP